MSLQLGTGLRERIVFANAGVSGGFPGYLEGVSSRVGSRAFGPEARGPLVVSAARMPRWPHSGTAAAALGECNPASEEQRNKARARFATVHLAVDLIALDTPRRIW